MKLGAKTLFVVAGIGAICASFAYAASDRNVDNPPKANAAAKLASQMSSAQLVGQRITTGYVGTKPPISVLRAVRAGRVGGVILFTNNMPTPEIAKRAINRLQRWAKAGGLPPLLVMIDQEGGIVQRLPQIPPTRSPASIGRSSDPAAAATRQGKATGRALAKYGFNVNLAPVVDVVKVEDSFLGNRAYSSSAKIVADAGCAFSAGNEARGVATAFKHFPGLGRAAADTDFNDVTITASRKLIDADNRAYRQCPETPSMVMLSSARYPRLGIDQPASLEKKTYALLKETGFAGLTITDALETPQFGRGENTARAALKAGADILLWGQAWRTAMRARSRLLSDLRSGKLTREELVAGTERIIALKGRVAR